MRKKNAFDYKNKDKFIVQFYDNQVEFDLRNPYTKKWFLPRYDFGKIHEPLMVQLIADILKPEDVFLDVGAHIGYFSIVASKLCKQIYAFEIDDNCVPIIQENIDFNKFKNIEIVNKAVSDTTGDKIMISKHPDPISTLHIRHVKAAKEHKEVETVSLSDFIESKKINPKLLKIDIEGAEYKAMLGLEPFLKKAEDTTLLLEIHPNPLKKFGVSPKLIIELLLDLGYKIKHFENHRKYKNDKGTQVKKNTKFEKNTMFLVKR